MTNTTPTSQDDGVKSYHDEQLGRAARHSTLNAHHLQAANRARENGDEEGRRLHKKAADDHRLTSHHLRTGRDHYAKNNSRDGASHYREAEVHHRNAVRSSSEANNPSRMHVDHLDEGTTVHKTKDPDRHEVRHNGEVVGHLHRTRTSLGDSYEAHHPTKGRVHAAHGHRVTSRFSHAGQAANALVSTHKLQKMRDAKSASEGD